MKKRSMILMLCFTLVLTLFNGVVSAFESNDVVKFNLKPLESVRFEKNAESKVANEFNTHIKTKEELNFNLQILNEDLKNNTAEVLLKGSLFFGGKEISLNAIGKLDVVKVKNDKVLIGPVSTEWNNNWINLGIHYSEIQKKMFITCVVTDKEEGVPYRVYFGKPFEELSIANKQLMEKGSNNLLQDKSNNVSGYNRSVRAVEHVKYVGTSHKTVGGYRVSSASAYIQDKTVRNMITATVKGNSNTNGVTAYYTATYDYDQYTQEDILDSDVIESHTYIDFNSTNIAPNILSINPTSSVSSYTFSIWTPWTQTVSFTLDYQSLSASTHNYDGNSFYEYAKWDCNGISLTSQTDYYSTTNSDYATVSKGHGGTATAQFNSNNPTVDFPGAGNAGAYFKYRVRIMLNNNDLNDFVINEYYISPTAHKDFSINYGS